MAYETSGGDESAWFVCTTSEAEFGHMRSSDYEETSLEGLSCLALADEFVKASGDPRRYVLNLRTMWLEFLKDRAEVSCMDCGEEVIGKHCRCGGQV